ncbi:helix-turn-helix transcriptional regulator [Arsukibacterium sp.]|uniref:helix-turn-helix transcriptional regulator n=1 Tax=Arsukibacterium sp. TaxID=1977258 RepID=UPI002FDABEDE
MEMKVNRDLIISERSARAWSQQQLADVASVSLRTIQRIEKSGVSSNDSLQAICAAFDKAPSFFIAANGQTSSRKGLARFGLGVGFVLLASLVGFNFSMASAETVTLNVDYRAEQLATGDVNAAQLDYLVTIGSDAALSLPNNFILVIHPKNTSAGVTLDVTLKSATGESLIPNDVDTTITRNLTEGVNIKFEKKGSLLVNIAVSAK